MPQRALRQVMSVQDIYAYAEPIMQMLREAYGSYDADVLDEVQVDDSFVQRLQSRGYELRVPVEPASGEAAPSELRAVAPRRRTATTADNGSTLASAAPASPTSAGSTTPAAGSAVPAGTTNPAPAASPTTPRPVTRTRRAATPAAAPGDASAPATPRRTTGTTAGRTTTPRRTTRTARASSDGEINE